MSFEPRKTEVEFADWTAVVQFLEEAVHTFLKNNRLLVPAACINDDTDTNSVDADSAGMLIVVKNALEITFSIYTIVRSYTIDNLYNPSINFESTGIMKHKSMKHKDQYSKKGKNKGRECAI